MIFLNFLSSLSGPFHPLDTDPSRVRDRARAELLALCLSRQGQAKAEQGKRKAEQGKEVAAKSGRSSSRIRWLRTSGSSSAAASCCGDRREPKEVD